jgi:AbiTii
MKLIADIMNDLVNDQISLTVPLNKTKILASRIGNKPLYDWVDLELKGYPSFDSVPDYRKAQGTVKADLMKGSYQLSNYPLQFDFGEDLDKLMKEFKTVDSIATIEGFLLAPDSEKKGSLVLRYPDNLMASLENMLQSTNGPYLKLFNVGISVPLQFANGLLAAVKNKLLDFMIAIEEEFGLESEISDLKNNNSKISYIMNNTITNNGDGNVVNTGANASVTANIQITKGNKEQLARTLQENGVKSSDIAELLTIIDTESPQENGYGS